MNVTRDQLNDLQVVRHTLSQDRISSSDKIAARGMVVRICDDLLDQLGNERAPRKRVLEIVARLRETLEQADSNDDRSPHHDDELLELCNLLEGVLLK